MLFCALHLAMQLSTDPPAKPSRLALGFSAQSNAATRKNELPSVVCVSALFFSHHTDEQPRSSSVSVGCYAAFLLWISSCLLCHRLHPWDAHAGFHGCGGKMQTQAFGLIIFLSIFKEARGLLIDFHPRNDWWMDIWSFFFFFNKHLLCPLFCVGHWYWMLLCVLFHIILAIA